MAKTEHKRAPVCRQTIIIKKGLQYRYMAIMAVSVLAGFLIFAMEVALSITSIYRDHPALLNPLLSQTGALVPAFLLKVLIYFVIVLLVASVVSHRMAGPIYKFEKTAQAVCNGDLTHRVLLRKGDQLHDLQTALNLMIASLHERVKTDRDAASKLADELGRLAEAAQNPDEKSRLLALREAALGLTKGFKLQ